MLAPIYAGRFFNEPLSGRIPASMARELRFSTVEVLQHPGLPPKRTDDIVTAAILVRARMPFPVVVDVMHSKLGVVTPKAG